MADTIFYRFVVKRDTAAAFVAANTVLLSGEWALEIDTGLMKMGDGVTAWNSLNYRDDKPAVPLAIVAGVATVDCKLGDIFTLALSANATLAFTNPPQSGCVIIEVTQGGAFVLTIPASVSPVGAAYATAASGKQVLGLMTANIGVAWLLAHSKTP